MARKPQVANFLGLELVDSPYAETIPDLIRTLKGLKAPYLRFGSEEVAGGL